MLGGLAEPMYATVIWDDGPGGNVEHEVPEPN